MRNCRAGEVASPSTWPEGVTDLLGRDGVPAAGDVRDLVVTIGVGEHADCCAADGRGDGYALKTGAVQDDGAGQGDGDGGGGDDGVDPVELVRGERGGGAVGGDGPAGAAGGRGQVGVQVGGDDDGSLPGQGGVDGVAEFGR